MIPENVKRRFLHHVDKREPNECWLWKKSRNRHGYGQFNLGGGKISQSHIIAWRIDRNRDVPANADVMHLCHIKHCCNPAHLQVGTRSDNMAHSGYSGKVRSDNKWGITGISFLNRDMLWRADYCRDGVTSVLYEGKDFFEACCARKSWESRQVNPLLRKETKV